MNYYYKCDNGCLVIFLEFIDGLSCIRNSLRSHAKMSGINYININKNFPDDSISVRIMRTPTCTWLGFMVSEWNSWVKYYLLAKSNSPLVEIQNPEKYHMGIQMEEPLRNTVCRKIIYCIHPEKERKVWLSDEMYHHNWTTEMLLICDHAL